MLHLVELKKGADRVLFLMRCASTDGWRIVDKAERINERFFGGKALRVSVIHHDPLKRAAELSQRYHRDLLTVTRYSCK
jgi:hypothetical protein